MIVGFDVADQLLIRFCTFADTGEEMRVQWHSISAIHRLQESLWSVTSEVLYNTLKEFEVAMCLNETYSKVHISKYLSDNFPIQNGVKQGGALSPLIFNFALDYVIRKVKENQVWLKLNQTHQLLAYADDVNQLGDNIDTIQKNTDTLIDASKKAVLEIN
jgi:hypothetical protein